jgi:methyl-accepting chemotaxis protein
MPSNVGTIGRLLGRLGMTARIVMLAGAVSALGTIGCIYAVVRTVEQDSERRANQALEANLALLRGLGTAEGGSFRVEGERLLAIRRDANGVVAETSLNGRNDIVDEVKRSLGGVATIFRGDTRVATNVTRPDGTRGVGTRLAAGPAHEAIFRRGETYRGFNEILGRMHMTIYEPIRDASGQLIGIWFVGLPVDEFRAQVNDIIRQLLMIGAATLISSIVFLTLLARWQLAPLGRLRRRIEAVVAGEDVEDNTYTSRRDEIGSMSRAVEVFRENAQKLAQAEAEKKQQEARIAAERRRMMEELGQAVGSVVDAASRGDFSRRVEARFDDEEMRKLGEGLNRLVGTVQGSLDDLMNVMQALGSGDLTTRVDKDYEGAFGVLASGTNGTAEKLADVIGRIGEAATTLDSAAAEILAGANDLAQRTSTQAAMVEETAAAVEEFSTTVQTNASRASRASDLARTAETRATEGGVVMKEAQSAMGRIDEASARISEVVGLIENIAFQTNLLALNASVEAARAGEAGRGFAVVASEVRRLAQHASEASTEVKSLISTSVTEVRSGVELVTRAGGSLEAIVGAINEVTSLMVEIAGVSKEQAITIGEIGSAVRKLDEMTQQNAALVEETNSAIHMTEQQVSALNGTVGEFKLAGGGGRSARWAA